MKVPKNGFPVPVERFTDAQVTLLACGECGATRQADPDIVGRIEQLGVCHVTNCRGFMEWAYMEGDRCKGCGTLGWFDDVLNHCCSRACMLQAEYAESLGQSA